MQTNERWALSYKITYQIKVNITSISKSCVRRLFGRRDLCHDIPFYLALTGFLKPGPKYYEGSLPQPRKSPSSSLSKVSGMRKLCSPFLLSCGC